MKYFIIQLATILGLALTATTAPAASEQDCDLELVADAAASNSSSKTVSTPMSPKITQKAFLKASATNNEASTSGSAIKVPAKASSTKAGSSATTTSKPTSNSPNSSAGSLPASSRTSALSVAQTIEAGGSFDGGMVMYDRGVSCTGQIEGEESDAVFHIENGGSLSNVIVGPNQIEGVNCQGACTPTKVWWSAVCEDAFSTKKQVADETTTINGGGAFGASDKIVQHNGAGTVSISGFTVSDFGKLYRSCGNCDSMFERHAIIDGVTASMEVRLLVRFHSLIPCDKLLSMVMYQLELWGCCNYHQSAGHKC
jgi:hypothetical protein